MLGIDVSKKSLSCTLLDPLSRGIVWQTTVENTGDGVAALLSQTPACVPLVVEPTGRYSLLVARTARDQGYKVLLAEPKKAKHYLRSLPTRAKTDALDSYGLSLFGLSCPLPPYPIKDPSVDELDQLLKARRGLSRAITALKQRAAVLPHGSDYLLAGVTAVEEQVKALDKRIKAHRQSDPRFDVMQLLETVPGVGPVTSAAVASCLIAKRFTNPDQFVAFCGLDPTTRQSGQKEALTGLSKHGDAELRRLLYLAAQATLRCKASPYKPVYQRHRDKGLATTPALCAVARKIARTCWSIHKYNTPFDPLRISNSQPTTVA